MAIRCHPHTLRNFFECITNWLQTSNFTWTTNCKNEISTMYDHCQLLGSSNSLIHLQSDDYWLPNFFQLDMSHGCLVRRRSTIHVWSLSTSWQLKLIHSLAVWWLASKLLPTWHESWVSCKKEIYNPWSWELLIIWS
jgi:hypothetical protein